MIATVVSDGFLKRRSDHYRELCKKIEIFISKFYLFTNQALEDGVINTDELAQSEALMKEWNSLLNNHKTIIKQDNITINDQLKLLTEKVNQLQKLK